MTEAGGILMADDPDKDSQITTLVIELGEAVRRLWAVMEEEHGAIRLDAAGASNQLAQLDSVHSYLIAELIKVRGEKSPPLDRIIASLTSAGDWSTTHRKARQLDPTDRP
jgi:hypothetical protein